MTISEILANEVIALSRRGLAVPASADGNIDEVFLSALVRRAASMFCPCSPSTLANEISESLYGLSEDTEDISEKIEEAITKAVIAGDLLELSQTSSHDPKLKSTWVFAASPSFVALESGAVYISGVAGENASSLPDALTSRIIFDRHFRRIQTKPDEDLITMLRDYGLIHLSPQVWLRGPKEESAEEHWQRLGFQLNAQSASGEIADLQIIDPHSDPIYYRGRWTQAKKHTGVFVARRPQAYGAPLWGLVKLSNGAAEKFLDFPLNAKFRGADCAWQAQMAADAVNGTKQRYRIVGVGAEARIDFFSPIPLWAERRLAIVGRTAPKDRCLFSYLIPRSDIQTEESFIQSRLWLTPIVESERRA